MSAKAEKQILTKDDVGDAAAILDAKRAEAEKKRLADIEKRRMHPQLGAPAIRFYQADDAADAPGAWYAAFHSGDRPDVRLHDADSKYMHDLAQRLLGGPSK